jgi:glutamate synthase domain-containing protein 3
MNGAKITVHGNAQDGVGNTMNDGRIVIRGDAGDIISYGMRGGRLYIAGDVGYRTGIHMKSFQDQKPVVVIGGTAQDYLGEYMAGGMLVVLNLQDSPRPAGDFLGTGMHGGKIYLRGRVPEHQVGREVGMAELGDEDWEELRGVLDDFFAETRLEDPGLAREQFTLLYPKSLRPYGNLYAY